MTPTEKTPNLLRIEKEIDKHGLIVWLERIEKNETRLLYLEKMSHVHKEDKPTNETLSLWTKLRMKLEKDMEERAKEDKPTKNECGCGSIKLIEEPKCVLCLKLEKPKDSVLPMKGPNHYKVPLVTLKEWNEKTEEIERLNLENHNLDAVTKHQKEIIDRALEGIKLYDDGIPSFTIDAQDMKDILGEKSLNADEALAAHEDPYRDPPITKDDWEIRDENERKEP